MHTVQDFPHAVEEHENVWIEMAGGARLAARIWLPEGAESAPVTAILEYIPYRKRDMTAVRDSLMHPYIAGHGYACVRVSDVAPDGKATRVSYGLLNLTHRASSRHPEALEPGRFYRVHVKLNDVAQAFPPGHRIRLSLSTSYWSLAWPPPEPVRQTIRTAASSFTLPVRPPSSRDADLPAFGPPEAAEPLARTMLEPAHHNWRVIRDLAADVSTLEVFDNRGEWRLDDIDLIVRSRTVETYSSRGDDFTSLRGEVRAERALRRGDWSVRTLTRTVLTSDAVDFHIQADLDAWEGDKRVHAQSVDRRGRMTPFGVQQGPHLAAIFQFFIRDLRSPKWGHASMPIGGHFAFRSTPPAGTFGVSGLERFAF
jgi:hypothetical protein